MFTDTLSPMDPVTAGLTAGGGGADGRAAAGDRERAVYRYATARGALLSPDAAAADLGLPLPEVHAAIHRLVDLHLLEADDAAAGALVPRGPQVAAALLISPIERAMYQRRELADTLREHIEDITRPEPGGTEPAGAIDVLHGVAEIRGLCKLAAEVCRSELIVLRPSHGDGDVFDELFDACYGILAPGISLRIIGPHRNRAGFDARAKAARWEQSGAQIRTLSQVPQAAVVFDRTLAVMVNLSDSGGEPTARRVRDQNVVRFLISLFDQLWESATPFSSDEPGYAAASDDLQRTIARLMAQGFTDEVVARRLGMSVRTCRRHIAAMLQNLDAVSRFQAGVQAATRFTLHDACGT
ncbi:helix-turn-helix transcriptional regulator [Actinospica durhamensis]|uniref:Helix-turn-helix transcriptional regulator n=1 Tax=Actinospica durhamensis TaxID=1508375 RepID=A0A941IN30_9ACTN|nr:helix-turn-helix transcriptional regulator [Actinospica durhamensis]MBR7833519.1 helix-turn-helix transcriptional regulator [Actinospica durhamensis]